MAIPWWGGYNKMAQLGKLLAAQTDNLSMIPGTHRVEGRLLEVVF